MAVKVVPDANWRCLLPHNKNLYFRVTDFNNQDLHKNLLAALGRVSQSTFRWLSGFGIVPLTIRSKEPIGVFWSPTAARIGPNPSVFLEDRIDYHPRRFDRVFTGEQRAVADHRVAQEPLVGGFLSRLFFNQVKFALIADIFLACTLHARSKSDR